MTPRPSRLILAGYGPLAAVIPAVLVITLTVPSKSDRAADAAEFAFAGPADLSAPAAGAAAADGRASSAAPAKNCLLLLSNGLQQAGPNLNPQSFAQGLFGMGERTGEYGQRAPAAPVPPAVAP